jgi:hypothetical protein
VTVVAAMSIVGGLYVSRRPQNVPPQELLVMVVLTVAGSVATVLEILV